jgi:hypothetical protein
MARTLKILVLAVVFASSSVVPSSAAPKVGVKCKTKNALISNSKESLKCVSKNGKLTWQRVAIKTPQKEEIKVKPAPVKVDTNPVRVKIEQMAKTVTASQKTNPPPVEWVATDEVSPQRLQSLKEQHQRLSDAFPTLYIWSNSALGFISTDPTVIRTRMENEGCTGGFIDSIKNLEANPLQQGAGTTYCRGRFTAFFLDRNTKDAAWNNILGSEFGGVIQENSTKLGNFKASGNLNWYSATPKWYSEGSQTILSVIAEVKATGKWNLNFNEQNGFAGTDWCMSDSLYENRCPNLIGMVALELGVALYGWDAPTRLFQYLDVSKSQDVYFQEAFGDPLETFNKWAISYLEFLKNKKPLPADLMERLNLKA